MICMSRISVMSASRARPLIWLSQWRQTFMWHTGVSLIASRPMVSTRLAFHRWLIPGVYPGPWIRFCLEEIRWFGVVILLRGLSTPSTTALQSNSSHSLAKSHLGIPCALPSNRLCSNCCLCCSLHFLSCSLVKSKADELQNSVFFCVG